MLSIASFQSTAFSGSAVGASKVAPQMQFGGKGKAELEINRYRECELTHGRVGMLASLGFLVQEKFHPLFSGDGGPAIDQIPALPAWVWGVMLIGITGCEIQRIAVGFAPLDKETKKAPSALKPTYTPGDLGF